MENNLRMIDKYYTFIGEKYTICKPENGQHEFWSYGYHQWANNLDGLLQAVVDDLKLNSKNL